MSEPASHMCFEATGCSCSLSAFEPDDECPLHGYPWPPRCVECGRFLKWFERNQSLRGDSNVYE